MCGIIGYTGHSQADEIILGCLDRIDSIGYDSAGIAVGGDDGIFVKKMKGTVDELKSSLKGKKIAGTCGIGHIRWATHGIPADRNAHPHTSMHGKVTLVHNGCIGNHMDLKNGLKGYSFASETDTEVLADLIEENLTKGMSCEDSFTTSVGMLNGLFAVAAMFRDEPGFIYAASRGLPLTVGKNDDGVFLSSDASAIAGHVKSATYLETDDIAKLNAGGYIVKNNGTPVERKTVRIGKTCSNGGKNGRGAHMHGEILEQPETAKKCFLSTLKNDNLRKLDGSGGIVLMGCGSSYHSALMAEHYIRKICGMDVRAAIASEISECHEKLVFAFSQSGETGDVISAIRRIKKPGMHIVAVVNNADSTIARESETCIPLDAGPELSVAATKSFTAQLAASTAIACGLKDAFDPKNDAENLCSDAEMMADAMRKIVKKEDIIEKTAKKYSGMKGFIFSGKGADYIIARESALKVMETCFILSSRFPVGELKHGPIAMVSDPDFAVCFIITEKEYTDSVLNAASTVKSKGGKTIVMTSVDVERFGQVSDDVIAIQDAGMLTPIVAVVASQLFAYYMSIARGNDPDKPRNLTKSVTVE